MYGHSMTVSNRSVEHWLDAAERARAQARRAFARAARTRMPSMAGRFEQEARIHLAAADCFEQAAVSTFETHELELRITGAVIRSLA
jgi:hypothetical protein